MYQCNCGKKYENPLERIICQCKGVSTEERDERIAIIMEGCGCGEKEAIDILEHYLNSKVKIDFEDIPF